MKLLLFIILLPIRIVFWILRFILGSIIRTIILIALVGLVGYLGLGWFEIIDMPYLDPIRAGFEG